MDGEDLEDYEELFETNTNIINLNLNSFDKKDAISKSQSLKVMKRAIQEMEENAKAYKQKIFEMPKSQEKDLLDKHDGYLKQIKDFKEEYDRKQKAYIAGNTNDDSEDNLVIKKDGKIDYNKNTSEQVINHGLNTQAKSKNAVDRIEARVEELKGKGDNMIKELERQEDIILKI